VYPRPLPPGGRIGICAPAGPVKTERLKSAVAALEAEGYAVEPSPSAFAQFGILSAPDDVRKRELEELFARNDIDAVFCARGGVGTSRLLETLDTELIAKSLKPFLGFSDVTALQWWLFKRHGFVSFSGPLAVEWDGSVSERTRRQALQMIGGEASTDLLGDLPRNAMSVLRGSGRVQGSLMPANLTMITTLLGTPYLPDLAGSILLIEDVGEPPYRIDRMLFHLRNAGILNSLGALVCGDLGETVGEDQREILERSLLDATRGSDYPILTGFPYAHGPERATLPIGGAAQLDTATMTLSLIEPVVRA
jgi:muramoyltetrapeptide carboxypeptidase